MTAEQPNRSGDRRKTVPAPPPAPSHRLGVPERAPRPSRALAAVDRLRGHGGQQER